ncbi:hypothetical protein LDENG_00247250 [Lucifuga dentata]|nr:hypothetical protein LDENG_00247250 [Lucifuga dentata]
MVDDRKNKKPSCGDFLVLIYAVGSGLLIVLASYGVFLKSQNFQCGRSDEDATRLETQDRLIYLPTIFSLMTCLMFLLAIGVPKSCKCTLFSLMHYVLIAIMIPMYGIQWQKETQEKQEFKERYLSMLPLTERVRNTQNLTADCSLTDNILRWQAEFKCCGLTNGSQDWNSTIPDSCFCEEADGKSCVIINRNLISAPHTKDYIYKKPCLPIVLSLIDESSYTLWTIAKVLISLISIPLAVIFVCCISIYSCICCSDLCYELSVLKYKLSGGVEMMPVVFIRKNNNNETEENRAEDTANDSRKDESIVLDIEEGTKQKEEGREAAEVDTLDNALCFIPRSELTKLQEELEPPPVQHQVQCLCLMSSKTRHFYIIHIDEGSPLLPSNAVLNDANKPKRCLWAEGHHIFSIEHQIWPQRFWETETREQENISP